VIECFDYEIKIVIGKLKFHIAKPLTLLPLRFPASNAYRLGSGGCGFALGGVHRGRLRVSLGVGVASMVGVAFLRGLPPRREIPSRTSIAPLSLSRSAISRLSMWSVGI
jgi:hypothetical protein